MKKMLILILLVLGALAIIAGVFLTKGTDAVSSGTVEAQEPSAPSEEEPSSGMDLEPFTDVEIKAISPDIRVEEGESWSVSYRLHGRERVERMEVIDGTFYFETGFDRKWSGELEDWELVLTVPADAVLEELDLSSTAGDIVLSDRSFTEGDFTTVSGEIALSALTCEELEAKTVSGPITVAGSTVDALTAENTSGTIDLSGDFGEAEVRSVSGDCLLTGTVAREAEVRSVSGHIRADVSAGAVEAASVGGVVFRGADQGRRFALPGEAPKLELKSTSGRIEIQAGT